MQRFSLRTLGPRGRWIAVAVALALVLAAAAVIGLAVETSLEARVAFARWGGRMLLFPDTPGNEFADAVEKLAAAEEQWLELSAEYEEAMAG